MGSFLDSNFSLDVVTESPWVYETTIINWHDNWRDKLPTYQILRPLGCLWHRFCTGSNVAGNGCKILQHTLKSWVTTRVHWHWRQRC